MTVKLQPLESQCTLHDSFPVIKLFILHSFYDQNKKENLLYHLFQLKDGRKATGGKLELKIRLRNPILFKQIENVTDKWLTIDQ